MLSGMDYLHSSFFSSQGFSSFFSSQGFSSFFSSHSLTLFTSLYISWTAFDRFNHWTKDIFAQMMESLSQIIECELLEVSGALSIFY